MNIIQHITDLLFDHECVIIPGFGGFISNITPSQLDNEHMRLLPPTSHLAFNTDLKANDGLLADCISRAEKISYRDALTEIKIWVDGVNYNLKTQKSYTIPQIGILKLNNAEKIEFDPFETLNFNAASFGLPVLKLISNNESLNIPPVAEEEAEERYTILQKPTRFITETLKWAAVITPFIALSIWGSLNKDMINDYVHNNSGMFSWIKFSNTSKSENVLTANYNSISAQEQDTESPGSIMAKHNVPYTPALLAHYALTKNHVAVETNGFLPDQQTIPNNTASSEPVTIANESSYCCYIIAGVFKEELNATTLVSELRNKGFAAADVVKNGSRFVVRIQGFATQDEAQQNLTNIHNAGYEDAWVMKK